MEEEPFVSIFSPNYNNSQFITEAIESILNQDYKNFEYIIIDDCSQDNSWVIIQTFASKDKRIKAFRNEKNLGIVKTRNIAFQKISQKSKYFSILDSDDIAIQDRISKQIKFLEQNEEYGLVGSNIIVISEKSKPFGIRKYLTTNEEIKKALPRYNPIAQPSATLRISAIKQTGFYDEKWDVSQDYDYFCRVGVNWKIANLPDFLLKYRVSRNQVKFTKINKIIKNISLIQKKAIVEYKYADNLINKLYRIITKIFTHFSKLLLILYYVKIISDKFIYKIQKLFNKKDNLSRRI